MQRYYKQIHDMPPLSEQEMNAHLAEESRVRAHGAAAGGGGLGRGTRGCSGWRGGLGRACWGWGRVCRLGALPGRGARGPLCSGCQRDAGSSRERSRASVSYCLGAGRSKTGKDILPQTSLHKLHLT